LQRARFKAQKQGKSGLAASDAGLPHVSMVLFNVQSF